MAHSVEAIVLMEDDRTHSTDHEVFVGRVSEGVPVVSSVTDGTLVKFGVGFAVHGEAGLNACDEEGGIVEAVFCRESQLLLCCLGWQFRVGGNGTEVRHDSEDTLGLLGSVGADGVGVGGFLLR